VHDEAGAALLIGVKVAPDVTIDPGRIAHDVQSSLPHIDPPHVKAPRLRVPF
jgi:hypothetical protein